MNTVTKLFFLTLIFFLLSCSNRTEKDMAVCNYSSKFYESTNCKILSDTTYNKKLLLIAKQFEPHHINLDIAIQSDTLFTNVIEEIGECTIREQTEYDTFLLVVFLKLYQYHLSSCHQGYDLLAMRNDHDSFLIDDLSELMNIDIHYIEMLNSGYVFDFVTSNDSYKHNPTITQLVDSISSIQNSIEKSIAP